MILIGISFGFWISDFGFRILRDPSQDAEGAFHAEPWAGVWPLGVTWVSAFDSLRERASLSIT